MLSESQLVVMLEVVTAAKLYGHDLRVETDGEVWVHLYCVRCRRSVRGAFAYHESDAPHWEEPCRMHWLNKSESTPSP